MVLNSSTLPDLIKPCSWLVLKAAVLSVDIEPTVDGLHDLSVELEVRQERSDHEVLGQHHVVVLAVSAFLQSAVSTLKA